MYETEKSLQLGVKISENMLGILFADHLVEVAETWSALQSLIDVHVYNISECWWFQTNVKKCVVVIFSKQEMYRVSGFGIMKPFQHVFWGPTGK